MPCCWRCSAPSLPARTEGKREPCHAQLRSPRERECAAGGIAGPRQAAALCAARLGPDRDQIRLRARPMRRLHRARRRRGRRAPARRRSRMPQGKSITTLEGLGSAVDAASDAGRLHQGAGAAMRLLHQRHDHERGRAARRKTRSRARPTSAPRSTAISAAAARMCASCAR